MGEAPCDSPYNITWKSIDILNSFGGEIIAICNVDNSYTENIRYEDIRIECQTPCFGNILIEVTRSPQYSKTAERGHIRGVYFKDITYSCFPPHSVITGWDSTHAVEDVTFDNVTIAGKPVRSAREMNLEIRDFVRNVRFLTTDAPGKPGRQ